MTYTLLYSEAIQHSFGFSIYVLPFSGLLGNRSWLNSSLILLLSWAYLIDFINLPAYAGLSYHFERMSSIYEIFKNIPHVVQNKHMRLLCMQKYLIYFFILIKKLLVLCKAVGSVYYLCFHITISSWGFIYMYIFYISTALHNTHLWVSLPLKGVR